MKQEKQPLKPLWELNLTDRFLFDEVMERPGAFALFLSILLEEDVALLEPVQTEKELRVSPRLRAVRLDTFSISVEQIVYAGEMQQRNTGNLPKRSRSYQAYTDVSLLEPGSTDFNDLKDLRMVMIMPFDLFGKGLYRYTFRGVCRECPELVLPDGVERIFINTGGTNKEDFGRDFLELMEYITDTTDKRAFESGERIRRLHREVQKIRLSEKMGRKYMQRWEELAYERAEGKEEGIAEGRAEGRKEGLFAVNELIQRLLRDGRLEDLARSSIDPQFQKQLLQEYHILA